VAHQRALDEMGVAPLRRRPILRERRRQWDEPISKKTDLDLAWPFGIQRGKQIMTQASPAGALRQIEETHGNFPVRHDPGRNLVSPIGDRWP